MKFDVVTLFPEMIEGGCSHSIISRAINNNVLSVKATNPRDFSMDKHRKVDDTPFGGGAGMVLMCQPYFDAFDSLEIEDGDDTQVILLSPQGEVFDQKMSCELAQKKHIVLLCGHYEGFDERIKEYTKAKEVSIGDYVLTGGELPALCLIDSISRNIEGCLGKIDSANFDSFSDGLLEHPHYTRPREYNGLCVPDVLLEGNHALITDWRRKQQIRATYKKRPDLFKKFQSTLQQNIQKEVSLSKKHKDSKDKKDLKLLNEVINEEID